MKNKIACIIALSLLLVCVAPVFADSKRFYPKKPNTSAFLVSQKRQTRPKQ